MAKVLEFQLQHSFRIDWFDLLAVQGTLHSLLQYHSSKASVLLHSAFFIVQLSHPYMITGKTIALTRWTFVGKVMSLLFNMLSRLVIAFLPRSKHLLIPWLQSPSTVIFEPQIIKSVTISIVSPSICHEVMGPDAMILVFWMLSFKPTFSLSSFTFIKRRFSSSSLFIIRIVSSAYLRLLIFLPAILIPACASSSPTFHMMYSVYKLNKQGDNIQPWRAPFPIWNQSVAPVWASLVAQLVKNPPAMKETWVQSLGWEDPLEKGKATLSSILAWRILDLHRFLRRQVRWSGIPISLRIFHSLLQSTQRLWCSQ